MALSLPEIITWPKLPHDWPQMGQTRQGGNFLGSIYIAGLKEIQTLSVTQSARFVIP